MSYRFRVAIVLVGLLPLMPAHGLDARAWKQDLDFLVEKISTQHANPWRHVDRHVFEQQAGRLGERLGRLTDEQITVELMQLVQTLGDGHTRLVPDGEQGLHHWYPIRFHVFHDGIYPTALPAGMAELAGGRVVRIANRDAESLLEQVTSLYGADNRFGRRWYTFLAANAELLLGLGIIDEIGPIPVDLEMPDGSSRRIELKPEKGDANFHFIGWGEMYGPEGVETVAAINGDTYHGFLDLEQNLDLPLHLRNRVPYWFHHDPANSLMYVQINYMTTQSHRLEHSLHETWERMLTVARTDPERSKRLVIDLRYNIGGDGSQTTRLVNRLIRDYPYALEDGHIFVLTSGKTFSAGVMLAAELLVHTPAILVGEPMGAPLNSSGDAEGVRLPNSGYQLNVSKRFWQLGLSDDRRKFVPVHIPAPFTGRDYFDRKDPALDHILSNPVPYPTLPRLLTDRDSAAAWARFETMLDEWSEFDFWEPVGRMDLDRLGSELMDQGREAEGITAFRINTRLWPDDWDTWDDLGQACHSAGQTECVVDAYERALALNPTNWNQDEQRQVLAKLRAGGAE